MTKRQENWLTSKETQIGWNRTPISLVAQQKISKKQTLLAILEAPPRNVPLHKSQSVFCATTGKFLMHMTVAFDEAEAEDEELICLNYTNLYYLKEILQ